MLLIAVLAVLTAVLVVVFVLRLARSPQAKVQLGTDNYPVGQANRRQQEIRQGGPLLFQALRGDLDLYVQHLGPDPAHGWLAFAAHPQGATRTCSLRWQPGAGDFLDPCDHVTYPADGRGLDQYRVTEDAKGNLFVDLRQATGTTPQPT